MLWFITGSYTFERSHVQTLSPYFLTDLFVTTCNKVERSVVSLQLVRRLFYPLMKHLSLSALMCLLVVGTIFGQETAEPYRIGLALSGGGARGLAHIGVLQVLEEVGLSVDYLAGTSIGSVVGGLYAAGYEVDELEHLALNIDWDALFTDTANRQYLSMDEKLHDGRYIASLPVRERSVGLPSGLIAGQQVMQMLSRLTLPVHHLPNFDQLPIPFLAVATDIETGEAVIINEGPLSQAIRASMAIPSVFTPVERDGRLLVDGGVARNLPAEDVRALGADYVICVDVAAPLDSREDLNSLGAILVQTISFSLQDLNEQHRRHCDLVIQPAITGIQAQQFERADELITLGKAAAIKELKTLQTLARQVPERPAKEAAILRDSVYVTELVVEGLAQVPEELLQSRLLTLLPTWMNADELANYMDRLYSTRFFEWVTYRLEVSGFATRLVIQVKEEADNRLDIGFRYDQHDEFAFLANLSLRNVGLPGSRANISMRVSDQFGIAADYFARPGFLGALKYTNQSFDAFEGTDRIAELRLRSFWVEALGASFLSSRLMYGAGLRFEHAVIDPRVAPVSFTEEGVTLMAPLARLWFDSHDHAVFPTEGQFVFLETLVAHPRVGSEVAMSQHRAMWRGAFALQPRLTLITDFELGASFGRIPLHRIFRFGGVNRTRFASGRFIGLREDEAAGRFLKKIGAGLQYETEAGSFVTLHVNIGNAHDEWEWNVLEERWLVGAGVSLGMMTLIGPLEFTLATGTGNGSLYNVNVGYRF